MVLGLPSFKLRPCPLPSGPLRFLLWVIYHGMLIEDLWRHLLIKLHLPPCEWGELPQNRPKVLALVNAVVKAVETPNHDASEYQKGEQESEPTQEITAKDAEGIIGTKQGCEECAYHDVDLVAHKLEHGPILPRCPHEVYNPGLIDYVINSHGEDRLAGGAVLTYRDPDALRWALAYMRRVLHGNARFWLRERGIRVSLKGGTGEDASS
jgi:hypothetical protein